MRTLRMIGACSLIAALLCLPGCGSARDIQNLAYVTAIGADYKNGKYVSYVQVLNFSNIAHSENAQLGTPVPIWIGVGDGQTFAGSLTDINTTSQLPLFWGHLKVVIVTENLLKHGVREICNTLSRYREVRYNTLVYGTKEKMMDILTQTSMFNLSPLDTIMFTGAQLSSQKAYLLPVNGNHTVANLNEPGSPGYIPSIALARNNWHEDKKSKSMFDLSGAYFFQQDRVKSWMSLKELKGIRWSKSKLAQTPLQVPIGGTLNAVIMMKHPHMSIKPVVDKSGAYFDLAVKVSGIVYEQTREIAIRELENKAAAVIENEIRATFRNGLAKRSDPFQLEEALYRKHPAVFKRLSSGDPYFLEAKSLRNVNVSVFVTSTGRLKGY
ncbi:Ger(x)C family spore germination protein [Paenibacillus rhizovicinus]|uniref:Ger(X)C family spore germination protein n=1 Tax=Paenibacillus rhizovicinus TaxID=2704463 RepID=A0A6C0NYJ3_9BACL|nr:Ger(x)C family spore germination protein [Paenibacillus rhizovicinus]QHW29542.1 Ger(x)C family spore germination protein [Paenibacillus rhizovicinus]